jgi:hypothetical protein
MRFLRTYEEFRYQEEPEVLEPEVIDTENPTDNPVDDSLLKGEEEIVDKNEVIDIKNWKDY